MGRDQQVAVTVTRLGAGPGYAHAIDDFGESYFIYAGNFQSTSAEFETINVGTKLTGIPIQHPKGWRLIEIRVEDL